MEQGQEIRLDFKTLDRERVMADMISEKNGIIQQLAVEVRQLRNENDQLKGKLLELESLKRETLPANESPARASGE